MLQGAMHRPAARLAAAILGTAAAAFAVNWFVVPQGLYSGGLMGLCQLLRTLARGWGLLPEGEFDFAGVLYLLLNIPLLFLGRKTLGGAFFRNTLVCTLSFSLLVSVIPVPPEPVVEDMLTSCLLGGILTGGSLGLILTQGCSTGGLDVLGLCLVKRGRGFTVGRLGLLFNAGLYALCLLLFDAATAIYSLIYTAFQMLILDRFHQQNIAVQALIFTRREPEPLQRYVMETLRRGVTCWEGEGSFTHRGIHILCTVLSKDEVPELRRGLREIDPEAFVIVQEGVRVEGNFTRKLGPLPGT